MGRLEEVGYIPYMRALDDRRRVYEVHVSQDIYQIHALIDIAHLCSFDEWRTTTVIAVNAVCYRPLHSQGKSSTAFSRQHMKTWN